MTPLSLSTCVSALLAGAASLWTCAAAADPAVTAPPGASNMSVFQAWNAFIAPKGLGGKTCFVVERPEDATSSAPVSHRDPAFLYVTSVPAQTLHNQVSTIAGYTFAANAHVTADVDGVTFPMFLDPAQPDTAWAVTNQEPALVEAMKHGTTLTLRGTSVRGAPITDTYPLAGMHAALDWLAQNCP